MKERKQEKKQGGSLLFKAWVFVSVVVTLSSAAIVFALFGTQLLGFVPCSIASDDMSPELKQGDIAYVVEVYPADIEEGTVVAYGSNSGSNITASRVFANDKDQKTLTVRPDSKPASKGTRVAYERVVGEVDLSLPYLGYAYEFVRTPQGFYAGLAACGVVAALFVVAPIAVGIARRGKRTQEPIACDVELLTPDIDQAAFAQSYRYTPSRPANRPVNRPVLRPGDVPSPFVAPSVPCPPMPPTPPLTINTTVTMLDSNSLHSQPQPEVAASGRIPQVVVRLDKDVHEAGSAFIEDELLRAEEDLRQAEKELDAVRAGARNAEVSHLRAQAEIKLAEAELLLAKAELIRKNASSTGQIANVVVEPYVEGFANRGTGA